MRRAMLSLARCPFPTVAGRPLVLGHRGASADAPENTLPAFREAMRQGADGVELDTMLCATGEPVVCHDEWLDRLAGVHLEVGRTSLSELRKLDVGSRFGVAFAGTCIPTLEEVLEAIPEGKVVNVELKCETVRDGGLAARVAPLLGRHRARLRLLVSSFNPLSLARARVLANADATGMLMESGQRLAAREAAARLMRTSAIHPEHVLCTRAAVERWHREGLKVAAWTVDAPEDVRRCRDAGVDALITNRPAAVLAALGREA